jgi:hypothetical protein
MVLAWNGSEMGTVIRESIYSESHVASAFIIGKVELNTSAILKMG